MRIKQSICYFLFQPPEMAIEPFFQTVAEIGYAGIDFWGPGDNFEDVVAQAKKCGLAPASMIGHESLTGGLNDASQHDRIEEELKVSVDIAARLGMAGLICFSGNRRPGVSDEEGIEITADGLRRVAPYAEKKGVNLNLELLNSKVDHPDYQCDRTAWGVAVCERVNSPRVKLLYDIYHMQIMEGDIIRTIQENIRWIGHFHTAGNPGRRDFDDTQEMNYTGICRAIAETGFDLYLAHEFSPKGDRIEALRSAFEICNQG